VNARERATTQFFEALADRGHEPMLAKISGTIRFDLTEPSKRRAHWLVQKLFPRPPRRRS
jgi:hypothetical protein